ncbi:reticulon-1-like isoform X3 [Chelonus insularis]|uniref:reticulon-1-like isoform X3 n=1 Tax=Chelonus insularis TaxID=460826 RepID=UPI00158AED16|nr:reticulon-1-like isoform X3 [Chelonus insularis]
MEKEQLAEFNHQQLDNNINKTSLTDSNIKRDSDSMDDFEHLEHLAPSPTDNSMPSELNESSVQLIDVPRAPKNLIDAAAKLEKNLLDSTVFDPSDEKILQPVPATPPPSADLDKFSETMSLDSAQTLDPFEALQHQVGQVDAKTATMAFMETERSGFSPNILSTHSSSNFHDNHLFEEKEHDFAPVKPLPPLPKEESKFLEPGVDTETGDSEFESEPEPSPAKTAIPPVTRITKQFSKESHFKSYLPEKKYEDEIAPNKIFPDIGLGAWFNPERLNPKVASLIYWRQPEKTGLVFGITLGILFSLAYFSLISVFSYVALLTLVGTMGFRIYKTILQAIQKTSDGHPFKDILELDLTLPSEKVHEVADIAVAHVNAAIFELRRLFLIEDFIDSLKLGVGLWCLTYVGSWFNGMTLIIIGVVALFTLPKVYETNKTQIDQNLALVQGKINEITAYIKAAIPLGKKAEPTKEE